MALAGAVALDEDALICDFAETYHVLDYEALSPLLAARLFLGLRDTARINLRRAGMTTTADRLLSAIIADRLGLLVWSKTKDAQRGRGRPASIAERLTTPQETGVKGFDTADAFEAAREKITKEVRANGRIRD